MATLIDIPAPSATFELTMQDGARILARRHGNRHGFRLYLSNGNGFAIDAYYPFWGLLTDRFDLVIFDMRNHGANPPAGFDGHNYLQMARDIGQVVEAIEDRLGPAPKAGVFHSMSARAAMKHAVDMVWIWDALVLFDPPNVPPKDHALYPRMRTFEMRLVEFAANRQERFASPQELADYYLDARAHRGWVDGTHDLMARSVLRHDEDLGDWALTCPPEYEATIYLAALTIDLWPAANAYGGPVKLIGADPELEKGPPTGPANRALGQEGGYDYEAIAGTGHMLQLERPDACADALIGFLQKCGLIDQA